MALSREQKLMDVYGLDQEEAAALEKAGLGLPKDIKKAKTADLEKVLGKGKAAALKAKLPKEK